MAADKINEWKEKAAKLKGEKTGKPKTIIPVAKISVFSNVLEDIDTLPALDSDSDADADADSDSDSEPLPTIVKTPKNYK